MSLPIPESAAFESRKNVRMARTYSPPIAIAPNSEISPRNMSVASSWWLCIASPPATATLPPEPSSQARGAD